MREYQVRDTEEGTGGVFEADHPRDAALDYAQWYDTLPEIKQPIAVSERTATLEVTDTKSKERWTYFVDGDMVPEYRAKMKVKA